MRACVCGWVQREVIFKCVRVSAGVADAVLNLYELKAISRVQHVVGLSAHETKNNKMFNPQLQEQGL